MLSPYRILDLTDHRGGMAGYILGSLGAEIVLVESAQGSAARSRPPLASNGTSLEWWAQRRGAKSVQVSSHEELLELVAGADALIESPDQGAGLSTEELHAINPSLVHTTITAFGSTGPKADWLASDLIIGAAGCSMAVTGDSDRAPLRTTTPQSWLHAGGQAASGTALALRERSMSGLGQHVDVSAQQAMLQNAFPGVILAPNDNPQTERTSGGILALNYHLQFVYPAADGFVSITLLFGSTIGRFTDRLMEWVCEAGFCDEALRDLGWVDFGTRLFMEPEGPGELELAKAAISAFTKSKTKAELFVGAQEREVLLAPVARIDEMLDMEHFRERDYWIQVQDPELGQVTAPGPWVKPSSGPLPTLAAPPALGQHTDEIKLPRTPFLPRTIDPVKANPRPLEGLKVVDTTWVYAGPFTTRILADMGATVIKVEGPNRPDAARSGGGGVNNDTTLDGSVQFGTLNAGKTSLTLDLNVPEGQQTFRKLCDWADIFIESYTPGTMDDWGMGYDVLRQTNPDLIMLSTSLMGATGPLAKFAGFGNLAGALTGYYEVTGWPGRNPAGPFLAYTDYVVPNFMIPLLMAALEQRERDGVGQHLDFAQAEAAIHFLGSAVLEYTVNGDVAKALGNDDRFICPHVVVPALGDDRWIAVVCETDGEWAALAGMLGRNDLSGLDFAGRKARQEELESLIALWCAGREMGAAEVELQGAGVPAHSVQNSVECFVDPQLGHRDHWVTVEHPIYDRMIVEATRFQMSRTPAHVQRSGPSLGEHNDHVLRDVLGYDDDQVIALAIAGAIG